MLGTACFESTVYKNFQPTDCTLHTHNTRHKGYRSTGIERKLGKQMKGLQEIEERRDMMLSTTVKTGGVDYRLYLVPCTLYTVGSGMDD